MQSIRPLIAVAATLLGSLLPLEPIQASAHISCPDVTDVHLIAPPPGRGATRFLPWLQGGQQYFAVVDLNYDGCTAGGIPPGLSVLVTLSSSDASVASVPVDVPIRFGDTIGEFAITTYPQTHPSTATISASLSSTASTSMVVLAATAAYTVTDLGMLPNAISTAPHAINSNATVVGVSGSDESGTGHAFVTSQSAGIQDLGTLPGNSFSSANGINDAGTIVGTSMLDQSGQVISRRAVVWNSGQIADLGIPSMTGSNGVVSTLEGNAINTSGHVAGTYETNYFHTGGFLWTPAGGFLLLGSIGSFGEVVSGMNDSDTVVGLTGGGVPIVWRGWSPAPLGVTPAQIQQARQANGGTVPLPRINNGGKVVFGNLTGTPGALLAMPGVPDGFGSLTVPTGTGLNDSGQTVGLLSTEGGASGFLYQGARIEDLNWVIDPASPWIVADARAINNAGQIAALGRMVSGSAPHALLLSPITQADSTPPVVTVPSAPVVAEATGPNGAAVSFTASASDPDNGPVPVSCSPASGSAFALGTTTVTCTATDAAGNLGSASFKVVVRDTTPPALMLSSDITVNATSPAGAVVFFAAMASDLVDGAVPVNCARPSGSTFAIGTTTVVCSASDKSGNTATGSFNVHVKGAGEQLADLRAYVNQNNLGPGKSLTDKLDATIAAFNASDQTTACATLQAFINEVQAQSGKKLLSDQATYLTSAANQIRAVLGC
ncbi:MAG TPA: HYR domain-containing protein [Candidatus Dormibacteraeota bacterium]|nr:HYR domain-containing protein [Candidatus Dormibacteraeota bacterium]